MYKENKIMLWLHMHQPDYLNPLSNEQILPWTRKHMLNSYYEIPKLLLSSSAKININFSGILLKQIVSYAEGELEDTWEILEKKDADSLTESEKEFIIRNFLNPFPNFNSNRFTELINKKKNREKFSIQDMRDTQMLYAISAFSPIIPEVKDLTNKKENYSEKDKIEEKKIERKIFKSIIPMYKELFDRKQIELTISPMQHPILPLLIDSSIAYRSKRETILPLAQFARQGDAIKQIEDAISLFSKTFGKIPQGMWPSEGSISNEAIDIIKQKGIKWIGTDESVLIKTNPYVKKEDISIPRNVRDLKTFFRNHSLSDKIGFVYNKMNAIDAVKDLLQAVKSSRNGEIIILDGENPWDFYPEYGVPFLTELFSALNQRNSALGHEMEAADSIESIHPGSWINGCFDTWIGDEESNRAWTYLADARKTVGSVQESLNQIYIAEGSDWFWWYSNFHKNEVDFAFDTLFRAHLIAAYQKAEIKIPSYLFQPIKEAK